MTTFGMTAPTVMKEPEADAGSLFVMKDGVLVLNTKVRGGSFANPVPRPSHEWFRRVPLIACMCVCVCWHPLSCFW